MLGRHVSNNDIPIGSLIISSREQAYPNWERVFNIYADVCKKKRGYDLPRYYGHAYPITRSKINFVTFDKEYLVSSSRAIEGLIHNSIGMCLLFGFEKDEGIRRMAETYFSDNIPIDKQELISDSWTVVRKL